MMLSVRFGLFVVILISTVSGIRSVQYKIVETLNGQIRGIERRTLLKGVPFYSFKGIPYAKPPVGDLRLKAPEPIESWTNVLNAFEHRRICVQPGNLLPSPFPQSEDCLTLNIYVPADVNSKEKFAVLFFIHGGAYAEGSGNDHYYGPDFIIENQTILITINYRLGLLGFLSLDTPEYSGNMGLKDQQLALKWVHSNIGRFGGDNKRITVFGQSAGGASIHFHILSAESRKYFHNAIPMSGVADHYWAMSEHNDHVELAYKIARDLGEPKSTHDELIAFLKSAPAEKLDQYSTVAVPNVLVEIVFTPLIERNDAKQPFIIDSPEKIYETQEISVNTLFTMTSSEVVGFISMFPPLNDFLNNFNISLPFRGLEIPLDSNEYRRLVDEVRRFYFEDNLQNDQAMKKYVELLSDLNYGYGTDKAVRVHVAKSKGKTYYQRFSVYTKLNAIIPRSEDVAHIGGAAHFDDIFYLFRSNVAQSIYDEILNNKDDKESKVITQAIENLSRIITNFAKYGEPSHKSDPIDGVQPVRNDEVHFIDIMNEGIKTGLSPNQKVIDFWVSIEQRAARLSLDLQKQNKDEL
ncbi:carboxylic ester hydrolase-like [Sitodiplosis mosellana]|uniref:carboxylic ester hydrolase-like n=1 Tax=Sitodiplosis mosellana TaxID=263140 RepID=UPI00244535DD|nr:carboxylic ester hydrolase-like [Sitodiplosis mosellana]